MKTHLLLFLLFPALLFGICIQSGAQETRFYGISSNGGINGTGAIFKTDTSGTLDIVYNFPPAHVRWSWDNMIILNDGRLCSTSMKGGVHDEGVVYICDPVTGNFSSIIDYEWAGPRGGKIFQASDGMIYAIGNGGSYGILYKVDPLNFSIEELFDFNGENGRTPASRLVEADNGKFYGNTLYGGIHDQGVLFEFDPSNKKFQKLIDFNDSLGYYPQGSIFVGKDGKIYGNTAHGGPHGNGVFYSFDPMNSEYKIEFEINESYNCISITQGSDGFIYGYSYGPYSAYSNGSITRWDPYDTLFTRLFEYNGYNTQFGMYPEGELIEGDSGKFYGITRDGGSSYMGVIFEWDNISQTYTIKFEFTSESGSHPSTFIKADNGLFYGQTAEGGLYNFGGIFQWNSLTGEYKKIYDFIGAEDGHLPIGQLLQASDRMLYGTTKFGGKYEKGIFYKLDPVTDTFYKILDFNGENGYLPTGYLTEAENGNIYGLTSWGGVGKNEIISNGWTHGTLFEFNPQTGILTKKIDFDGMENGGEPVGGLTLAPNGKLYGMTNRGGKSYDSNVKLGFGVLFEFDPVTGNYIVKRNFNPFISDGFAPGTSLVKAKDGKLYGVAGGGNYVDDNHWGDGVIFQWDTDIDSFQVIRRFDQSGNGSDPANSLTQAKNGKFYGITMHGGIYTHTTPCCEETNGVLYSWDQETKTYTKELDLEATETGYVPAGPMYAASDSMLYGMMSVGGSHKTGTFFKWDPEHSIFTKISELDEIGQNERHIQKAVQSEKESDYLKSQSAKNQIENVTASDDEIFSGSVTEVRIPTMVRREVHVCMQYISPSGKYIWTEPGVYNDTIRGPEGIDSIFTLNLHIHNNSFAVLNDTSCTSMLSPGGRVLSASGIYTDTIPNCHGCDSIITLNLTIPEIDISVSQVGSVLSANAADATYQWIDYNGKSPVQGEIQQTFTPQISGTFAVVVTQAGCADTSDAFVVNITETNSNYLADEISVLPNPAHDRVTVDLGRVYLWAEIQIIHPDGRMLRKVQMKNDRKTNITLPDGPGYYLVVIHAANNSVVKKIVKQ
jgi:uncharacterized repeat protein (TIGR03803 family)